MKKSYDNRRNSLIIWRPQGDLNPRYRRERAVSWARLDDGDEHAVAN